MANGLTRRKSARGTDRLTLVKPLPAEVRVPMSEDELVATIHAEIIPRLMMAHVNTDREQECADARLPPTTAEILDFAQLAVNEDVPAALAFVEKLCAAGLSLESIMLDLVAASARLLGDHWVSDLRPFTEVTAGLCTLQQVVHILGPSFAPPRPNRGFCVLVAVQPEQHTLGLYLLGEFLRRAGWGVHVAPTMSDADLLELVETEHVDMVGITVSNSDLLEPLGVLIGGVKKASQNRSVAVMLGGPLPLGIYKDKYGVTVCSDPRDAVRWLDQHVTLARQSL